MMDDAEKVIKDFQTYLGELSILIKKLKPAQRYKVAQILRCLLTLLVCLRQASHMGENTIEFIGE